MNTFIVGAIVNFVTLGIGIVIGVLIARKPGGSKPPVEIPVREVVEKAIERAVELGDKKKTTEEILKIMENLPEAP